MATGIVNPGYMGWASFGGGDKFRFESCNVSAKQDVNAPDLITGYFRRMAYNMGKIEINGTISGPVGERFAATGTGLWDRATVRGTCGELTGDSLKIHYFCPTDGEPNSDFNFETMKVNSVTFSCAAGEVAQFSADMIGAGTATTSSSVETLGEEATMEKLITWDIVGLTVTPDDSLVTPHQFQTNAFSNFEVTFANNIEAVYALGQGDLFPYSLVDGLTNITGSVSVYNIPEMYGVDHWGDYTASGRGTITFDVGSGPQELKVRWHRVEPTSSVTPIISTVAFTGVGPQGMD